MGYLLLLLIRSCFISTSAGFIIPEKTVQSKAAGIELIISNIRNNKGLIRIGVFDSGDGYPDKPSISFSLSKDTITSGRLRLFIPVKQPGMFGLSILDDENENRKMDYRIGIIPREGYGFSNNPGVTSRKAPPFSETRFNYPGGRIQVNVKMNYI
jgi:uncharacterized protein (DUF2141 family)